MVPPETQSSTSPEQLLTAPLADTASEGEIQERDVRDDGMQHGRGEEIESTNQRPGKNGRQS